MPFVKLDCGILNSSIWIDRPAREVFLTALLMAEPCVLDEPAQQIEIRSLDYTGFVVQPGCYGFVKAAGSGIIRQAGIEDTEEGRDALERLGSSEDESRSSEWDGRRLVRVNGGFIVLNFDRYRKRDLTGAERARRYREKQKAETVTRDTRHVTRDVTVTSQKEKEKQKQKQSKETNMCDFQLFWDKYPKRAGSNSRAKAEKLYLSRRKEDVGRDTLQDGVTRYAHYCESGDMVGTQFVMQAARWLGPNEQGWLQDWTPAQGTLSKDDEEELAYKAAEI